MMPFSRIGLIAAVAGALLAVPETFTQPARLHAVRKTKAVDLQAITNAEAKRLRRQQRNLRNARLQAE